MELDTFISETLRQILVGVQSAQAAELGMNVNAASPGHSTGNLIDGGSYGVFTRVDFDVAVTAETSGGGKASIKVWSIGAEGGADRRTQTANRVTFSVPVRLPAGDQSKEQELRERIRNADRGGRGGGGWMAG